MFEHDAERIRRVLRAPCLNNRPTVDHGRRHVARQPTASCMYRCRGVRPGRMWRSSPPPFSQSCRLLAAEAKITRHPSCVILVGTGEFIMLQKEGGNIFWFPRPMLEGCQKIIYDRYQYNALWAMNERAQARYRIVTYTCNVGYKLPVEIPQSILNHSIQAKSPFLFKPRGGVCNCARALTPPLLCRSHISYRTLLP